jgi:D-arabinose 5-phosphate isomerase GutQ
VFSTIAICARAGECSTPDITVAADGSGNSKTVNAAVQSVAKDKAQRIVTMTPLCLTQPDFSEQ